MKGLLLSVVIPVFNEEKNIPLIHERLLPVCESVAGKDFEIIFINDGSRDGSENIIAELASRCPEIKYLFLSRNFGHQQAVSAGLDYAGGLYTVIMDGDLQDPPELIPEMLEKAKSGFDVVYARRNERKGESVFKKMTARWFYRILQKLTQVEIPLDTGDFRLMHRNVTEVVKQMPEKNKFLRGQIAWVGFRQSYVEYDRDPRQHGHSGYPVGKMIRFALHGITGFSDVPLRLATWLGFLVSGISVLIGFYALYSRFVIKEYVAGWASLMLSILFLGGVQLICLGIIGEYLGRMYHDIRNRPLYVVRKTNTVKPPTS
jgi:glycosyltransferase involved in cell wall biosynthesis